MKNSSLLWILTFCFLSATLSNAASISIQKVGFISKTNMSAIQVKGENEKPFPATIALKGNELSSLEATLNPESLKTGLSLRDRHMVERIFQKEDKSVPPMVFKLSAPYVLDGKENTMSGTLSIRGQAVNFTPRCTGTVTGETKLQIKCAGNVNITEYGIENPSHLGVKSSPMVAVTLEAESSITP